MTFISKKLLLDLPLYKPEEGSWRDKSGHDHHAPVNPLCKQDSLPKLGSCVHLYSGGQLSLSSPLTGTENKLTVEFWVLPSGATKTALRQILGGPVEVKMNDAVLQWSLGGAEPMAVALAVDDALDPEPHHWAISADRADINSPFTFSVYRDCVEMEGIAAADNASPSSDGSAEELVIGGAADEGWTGRLAHLRIWGAVLTAQDLRQNKARDITAHVAFKASTGIDWRLLNADDEPSLYIKGNTSQELRLEVQNVTKGVTLVIPKVEATRASFGNRHFQLVFRPGTIATQDLDDFESDQRNKGWSLVTDKWDGQDCIYMLWTGPGDIELERGKTLKIYLRGLAAAPGAGSRTTRVMLTYKNLKPKSIEGGDSSGTLDGHRAQLLNIIYREPLASYRRPPLEVGVVGAPVILNNGTETCLTLYIKNLNRNEDGAAAPILLGPVTGKADKTPKFILEVDAQGPDDIAAGLGDDDDLSNTTLVGTVFSDTKIQAPQVYSVTLDQGDVIAVASNKVWNRLTANGSLITEYHETHRDEWSVYLVDAKENGTPVQIDLWKEKVIIAGLPSDSISQALAPPNLCWRKGYISPISIDKLGASGGVFRWQITLTQTQKINVKKVGLKENETIYLTLADLKTSAPPGRSVLRLRYEDFDDYGEGVFEIPVDRMPAVPAKITQGGAGYGLALGHDPRVGYPDPNTMVLNEVLSVKKQKGDGDAVRIENAGDGSGLSVIQDGGGPSAKFSGGSGVEIEIDGKLVLVAAKVVEIIGKLFARNDAEITGSLKVTERIRDKTGEVMPVGAILMWSGKGNAIPMGWVLCDGQNGTPNLTNRFVLGAGSNNAGENGEADTHTHTVDPRAVNSSYSGNHSHKFPAHWYKRNVDSGGYSGIDTKGQNIKNESTQSSGNHRHSVDIPRTNTSAIAGNRPRWYALCFIMKL